MDFYTTLQNVEVSEDGRVSGYVFTAESALKVVREFEATTNSRFVLVKKPATFGKQGIIKFTL